jgi:hypothetical protein
MISPAVALTAATMFGLVLGSMVSTKAWQQLP